jgi:hypothetical protein
MMRVSGKRRDTLRHHFRTLVERHHLVRHGEGKGSWYTLP